MKSARYWRYEVDEVWGTDRVAVGAVIIDKWKADRVWNFYDLNHLERGPKYGWHAKLLGEVTEPEALAQIQTNRAQP